MFEPRRPRLALLLSGLLATSAQAQTSPDTQVPEVLVTAQRSTSLASKTPLAISVLSGDQLLEAGVASPSDLGARLPNVYLEGAADGLKITIRGVSNADTTEKGDPSAAFLLDGIYLARPQNQDLAFYDLARVEVLRGPQGTLYGRNTTAGVVHVISNTPSPQFEAAVQLEAGNYASRKLGGMLNLPLSPTLAVRAAFVANRHDSYLRYTGGAPYALGLDRDDLSARVTARLALSAQASLLLRLDHSTVKDNPDNFVPDTNFYTGIESGNPRWRAPATDAALSNGFLPFNAAREQGHGEKRSQGIGAELHWDLGALTLDYLGARRRYTQDFLTNFYYRVAPGFALGVREHFDGSYGQNSHELRVATKPGGPLSAQAGLYYFREHSDIVYVFRDLELLKLPPYYVFPHGPTVASSRAAFGQASWSFMPLWRLTAGARYTDDDKSRLGSTNFQQGPVFNAATDLRLLNAARLRTHQTTWRLGLDTELAPDTLAYASLATGYKAGGFNDGCLAGERQLGIDCPAPLAVPAATLFYQPETLRATELGLKSRFWDKRASLNLAVFDYDYSNLQLSGVAIVMGAPRYVTTNAGAARVRGLEADGTLLLGAGGRLHYGLTWLDAHYVRYSPDGIHSWAGYKLDRAPSQVFTLGYEQRLRLGGGQLRAGISTRASAAYQIGVPTQLLQYRIPARTQTDLQLAYHPDGAPWTLGLALRNAENKVAPITIDSFGMSVPSAPRTVALRLDARY
ncbi:TonB-dependent receptor [Massilia sp. TS11]|uniref:TonB-dependent receptor n=1 Tax=Massilia sp. TS11 TaxID=2908003 RepID=UPI001EDAA2F7|nr:TonB-dependent receptor [Massilia sp. TS11]MCG2583603.1 TonB-dependent receptor [Massilia sp. TS11]